MILTSLPASDMKIRKIHKIMNINSMKQVLPEDVKETARMNDIAIQRGITSYNVDNVIETKNTFSNNAINVIFLSNYLISVSF